MKFYIVAIFILGLVTGMDWRSSSRIRSRSSTRNKSRYSYDVPKTCAASFTQTNGEIVACVQGAVTGPSKSQRDSYSKYRTGLDRHYTPEDKGDCGAFRILPQGGECKQHEIRYVINPFH